MAGNLWDYNPSVLGFGGSESKGSKRTLGIRDKQILYRRARGRCEACGRKIEFDEMESGHKNPASKGGTATLRNSVCICARCNKLQGTDSWATFMRKMGKPQTRSVTSTKKGGKKKSKRRRTNTGLFELPKFDLPEFDVPDFGV
ncbi:MAG: HNH endonuclease signature motif containing protein [Candidatus Micrarchaeota archaeon]|nr:HNH endonuclease signature motif containing protein [Candidatus Micrarchaeota archaeon]